MLRRLTFASALIIVFSIAATQGQTKRPLAIEDYYRVLTITNPQIAPATAPPRWPATSGPRPAVRRSRTSTTRPDRPARWPARAWTATSENSPGGCAAPKRSRC